MVDIALPELAPAEAFWQLATLTFSAHLTLDSCLQWCYLWTNAKALWHTPAVLHTEVKVGQSTDDHDSLKKFHHRIPRPFPRDLTDQMAAILLLFVWLPVFDPGIPIVTEIQRYSDPMKDCAVCRHLSVRWTVAQRDSCLFVFKIEKYWQCFPVNQQIDRGVSTWPHTHEIIFYTNKNE